MGARVIAVGRNSETLKKLAASHERIEAVQIIGDVQADLKSLQEFGPIDAFFDISPPEAANSTHLSCILALQHSGRVSFMEGLKGELTIPIKVVLQRDLMLKGKWMYCRQDVRDLIKLIEIGVLKLGGQKVDIFALEAWEKGFDTAAKYAGADGIAVIVP
jgi:threonine dehydrogenase-like Zn-dependent dehydrogenase